MPKNRKLTDFFKPFASPRAKPAPPDQFSIDVAHSDRTGAGVLDVAFQLDATASEHLATPGGSFMAQECSPPSLVVPALGKTDHNSCAGPGPGGSESPHSSSDEPSRLTAVNSNRQVIRNGRVVIKSSDDEDSTSSSLDDLDDLLTTRKPMIRSAPVSATGDKIPTLDSVTVGKRAQSMVRRSGAHGHPQSTTRVPVIPRYKFSLDSLVRQTEKDTASESDMAKARSLFRASEGAVDVQEPLAQRKTTGVCTAIGAGQVDENLLASLISGPGVGTSLDKVLNSMRRTEALLRAKSWVFFRDGRPQPERKPPPFPTRALVRPRWQSLAKGWRN